MGVTLAQQTRLGYTDAFDRDVCRMISGTVFPAHPELADLLDGRRDEKRFATEARSTLARLLDAIQLTLPADVILKLGDQCEDSHDEPSGTGSGVDCRIVDDLKGRSLVRQC